MKSGVTLVEMLIASALMALALAALMATLVMSKQHATVSNNRLEALHIARGHMERLAGLSYGNAALALGSYGLPNQTNDRCVYYSSYSVNTTGYASAKDLEVQVAWRDPMKTNLMTVSLKGSVSMGLHP
jgi:prepilin-type N-terminal cleavage/methylation domain-containing protein